MTRVAIVAAAAGVRAHIEAAVGASLSSTVVAIAPSIGALMADPRLASADVVLLHTGSRDVVRRELDVLPPIPVIALVARAAVPGTVQEVLSVGARGVLPEDATPEEVVAAIEAAAAGLVVVPAELIADLVSARPAVAEGAASAPARGRSSTPAAALTPREREILAMLAEGLPNKLIASGLGISEHTVKTHLEAIFEKLGASTRAEAVAQGVRRGLLLL